jgi:hypothetical protein
MNPHTINLIKIDGPKDEITNFLLTKIYKYKLEPNHFAMHSYVYPVQLHNDLSPTINICIFLILRWEDTKKVFYFIFLTDEATFIKRKADALAKEKPA